MEVFRGSPLGLQNVQLRQPLYLQPSHSLMKRSVLGVSGDLRCGKSSLSTTSGEIPSSVQLSLQGTGLKKIRLTSDSLRATETKLSSKFLENLSILKGFKRTDALTDKTNTSKLSSTTHQGAIQTKSSILKGWHVVLDLDKTSFQEKCDLKNEILSHGGTIGFSVTKKTTHLFVEGIQKRSFSYKRHSAQKYGVSIVSVDYVRDCLESGSVLNVESYLAADRVVEHENKENNVLLSGKIKACGKQRGVLSEKPEKLVEEEPFFWEDFDVAIDYQVAKFCFMKHLENESRCVQLELHVLTEPVARRFRIYCQYLVEDKPLVAKCFSLSSSIQAVAVYCKITKSLLPMFSITDVKSAHIGSPKFQKIQMETGTISADKLSVPVKTLVDIVWKEAIGTASASVDITSVTTEKVNKATVTLAQIKQLLVEGGATKKQLEEKSKQFYSQICHKGSIHNTINTKRKINQMQELCTLLQDVMNVQEASDWKKDVNITNKYRSLRCNIQSVDTYSNQYQAVMGIIGKEALESSRIKVSNIYSLTRCLEDTIFAPKGRKVSSLVHATRPASLLGIMSRGLLPPRTVQEEVGIERRDYGFLGQGIYFGDDIRSNMHFTEPNSCSRTRFVLVCEVIVGNQYKTWQHQPDFVSPPAGYDSVLGVKNCDGNHSVFKHNEYTIYDVSHQRLSYLIEFVQVNETPVIYQPELSTEDVEEPSVERGSKEIDVSDVIDVSDPLDKVTPGLQTSGGQPVLLEMVSVKAKMMDLVSQVTVFQRYRNTNTKPIEAKYVFPLDDTAAVCGFEAFIGDKHIVGEVKEKEKAHKEYKEAVSQGHGAYLMDEESADVFTVSVGNLPPSTEVIIKIIYVVELSVDDDQIVFHLPGSLASWRKEGALAEETQNVTSTVTTGDDTKIKFEMSLSMEMPFDINTISCSTHDIKIKRTAAKACITLAEGEDCLKEGFHLSVKLHKIHQPHMWVEQNPNDKDSQACMLTFYPEFEVPRLRKPDVTVVLDCSNSMKGESFEHAKKVCYMIASLMPKNYTFNLVKFGTNFKELYSSSRLSSEIDLDELKDFLAKASSAEGNTDVWRPLHSHYLLEGKKLRNVFIISDGHISNEMETLKSITKNSSHTRIFTFGVSTTCNKHMLKIMARSGAGSFEFFDGKTKSAWQRKVKNQLQRAGQPSVNSLAVKWHQFDTYAPKPRQAPRHLGALFSGTRLVVFGFVPYCTSATLTAVIDGQEISTIVSTSDLCITKGLTLHRLTARALIRDWEDGMLDVDRIEEEIIKEKEKQAIISLSRQYSIVTSLTSFVAIEKREKDEVQKKLNMEEKLKELLKTEDVDVLPYMDWQLRQEVTPDLDDKEKMEDGDGVVEDATSSSDDDSDEDLPSEDEIMDCALDIMSHFDREDCLSSDGERDGDYTSSEREGDEGSVVSESDEEFHGVIWGCDIEEADTLEPVTALGTLYAEREYTPKGLSTQYQEMRKEDHLAGLRPGFGRARPAASAMFYGKSLEENEQDEEQAVTEECILEGTTDLDILFGDAGEDFDSVKKGLQETSNEDHLASYQTGFVRPQKRRPRVTAVCATDRHHEAILKESELKEKRKPMGLLSRLSSSEDSEEDYSSVSEDNLSSAKKLSPTKSEGRPWVKHVPQLRRMNRRAFGIEPEGNTFSSHKVFGKMDRKKIEDGLSAKISFGSSLSAEPQHDVAVLGSAEPSLPDLPPSAPGQPFTAPLSSLGGGQSPSSAGHYMAMAYKENTENLSTDLVQHPTRSHPLARSLGGPSFGGGLFSAPPPPPPPSGMLSRISSRMTANISSFSPPHGEGSSAPLPPTRRRGPSLSPPPCPPALYGPPSGVLSKEQPQSSMPVFGLSRQGKGKQSETTMIPLCADSTPFAASQPSFQDPESRKGSLPDHSPLTDEICSAGSDLFLMARGRRTKKKQSLSLMESQGMSEGRKVLLAPSPGHILPPPPPLPPCGSGPTTPCAAEFQARILMLQKNVQEKVALSKPQAPEGVMEKSKAGRRKNLELEKIRYGMKGREVRQTMTRSREEEEVKTTEAFTEEPSVDSKFEMYKVPQLRKSTDRRSESEFKKAATELCLKMKGKCISKPEEVLELIGIPEKIFYEFFKHVGIYSLGQVAAEAFLIFFTTWLVYVFIKAHSLNNFGHIVARVKEWLDQQGSVYSVKNYYLGLSSWEEVARQMLGF